MSRAMFSKSLIQFYVDGQGCVPSLLFDLNSNYVEVMKIMVTSFKRSYVGNATLSGPNPAAGHHQPTLLPGTSGHSQASLGQSLVGSVLLSPGSWFAQGFFVPSKSLFPQSCVSSGGCMVGFLATYSKRAYAIPRPTAPRAPAPAAVHWWPISAGDTQTQFWLSLYGVSGS